MAPSFLSCLTHWVHKHTLALIIGQSKPEMLAGESNLSLKDLVNIYAPETWIIACQIPLKFVPAKY